MEPAQTLLAVSNLSVGFRTDQGVAQAVREISFTVPAGQTVGLVGESGCGKSVTSLSIMRLLDTPPAIVSADSVSLNGENLLALSPREMRARRGRDVAMIFQEPMTSLNPVFPIGDQLLEAIFAHERVPLREAVTRTETMLGEVGIPNPRLCMTQYPHELSGGMKQRIMIAMALLCHPKLLIADEPTTALDVTVQAQILDLLRTLQDTYHMGMLFITHDLGVVAELAHHVCVMYAGKMVESAPVDPFFASPLHPYSKGLLECLPDLDGERKRLFTIPGSVPSPLSPPEGCPFASRCAKAMEICGQQMPLLEEKTEGHFCACHAVAVQKTEAPAHA